MIELVMFVCGLFLLGILIADLTDKKKVDNKHNCFKKCRPVFENTEKFKQQLEEKKYSVKIKVLIIFQFLAFSSIIESKKGELCSKHYQEFKEISDKSILLVENIDKKYEELFNYYKYSNCSCKKVLEKIFKSMKFISEQLKEKKDNEKLELFDTLLKENRENFCDNHQKFYENFSNFSLFHE